MNSEMGDKLKSALEEKGFKIVTPKSKASSNRKKKRRPFAISKQIIGWEQEVFGNAKIDAPDFDFGSIDQVGTVISTRFKRTNTRPSEISVTIIVEPQPGVRVLCLKGGTIMDVTNAPVPPVVIPVKWDYRRRDGELYPMTREKDVDNVDLVYMRQDGTFVQLQVALTVRSGTFWLSAQEVFGGQIGWGTAEELVEEKEKGYTLFPIEGTENLVVVVPVWDDCAFPGSDYGRSFKYGAANLVEYAYTAGYIVHVDDTTPGVWQPPEPLELPPEMISKGWTQATCTFFNAVVGYGFLRLDDGTSCFVHFTAIQDDKGRQLGSIDQFPVLPPMERVFVKCKREPGKSGLKATVARIPTGH